MQYDPTRRSLYHPEKGEPVADFSPAWNTDQICAELSRLCYIRFDANPAARKKLETTLTTAGFSPPEYFIDKSMDAQAFATRADGTAYVVFRGTQAGKLKDVLHDLDALQINWMRGGMVHEGFCNSYLSLQKGINAWLATTARKRLVVTGHSLGAAMATLMATDHDEAELVTIGSPRVGDAAFVAPFRDRKVRRYVDCDDIVTMVPPGLLKYAHAGAMIYIDRHGILHSAPHDAEWIAEDRSIARSEYMKAYGWKIWRNVITRRLADHAPINYVSALLGRRTSSLDEGQNRL